MRAQEIIKLANTGYFEIFRINQINENSYILKRMTGDDYPTWEVIAPNESYENIMDIYQQNKSGNHYPLLYSHEFNTFDLKEISKKGFKIWRQSDDTTYHLNQFNPISLKWETIETFKYDYERNAFLNYQLMHPNIILVD